jgi:hypothetical protein
MVVGIATEKRKTSREAESFDGCGGPASPTDFAYSVRIAIKPSGIGDFAHIKVRVNRAGIYADATGVSTGDTVEAAPRHCRSRVASCVTPG